MSVRRAWSMLIMLAGLCAFAAQDHEDEMAAMREEIETLSAKTAEIRKEIEHVSEKKSADSLHYSQHIIDAQERVRRLRAQRDSLGILIDTLRSKQTSLEQRTDYAEVRQKNYRSRSSALLSRLAGYCKSLADSLEPLRIFNLDRNLSALRFLEGEISAGTVDAVEGMERYYQIVKQIEKHAQITESWTGAYPVAGQSHDASFLRVGCIWLACVTDDNSEGMLWNRQDQKWVRLTNQNQLLEIREAIKLLAGKAAPQLIALPFDHALLEQSIKEGEQ